MNWAKDSDFIQATKKTDSIIPVWITSFRKNKSFDKINRVKFLIVEFSFHFQGNGMKIQFTSYKEMCTINFKKFRIISFILYTLLICARFMNRIVRWIILKRDLMEGRCGIAYVHLNFKIVNFRLDRDWKMIKNLKKSEDKNGSEWCCSNMAIFSRTINIRLVHHSSANEISSAMQISGNAYSSASA